MNPQFEISEYGNLLMYRSSYSVETVSSLIQAQRLDGLRIFDHWDPIESTEFIRDFRFLKRLELAFRYDQDYSFLAELPQLEHLSIGPSYPMENPIDLSHHVNLKYLALQWRKNRIHGLDCCQNLQDLCLIEFKNVNLKLIENLTKIQRLRIKTGSMKSLEGIENLEKLEVLEVGSCRSLRSIKSLTDLPELRIVRIESCRKIQDYDQLENLPALKTLQLINCGRLPEVEFKKKFPNLENLELLGNSRVTA